jgi:serine/threonine protein kinase
MNPCLPAGTLRQLLDGQLTGAAADSVTGHVSACASCQAVLDGLSDDPALRQMLPAGRTPVPAAEAHPELASLLDRLHDPPRTAPPAAAGAAAPAGPLTFLAPARRPGDLGTLGPYPIEAELGRGGMGIVLRGWDEALQRPVALKVLRPELADERARARFVREARAAARVKHEHVVGVYAVCEPAGGLPYLVLEYLAGPTLAELLRARRRLPAREAAEVVAQAADGVAAAHAAGLVHRDVKPGNVLFDTVTGRAKIADFGLARLGVVPSGVTQEGALAGTPAYMSPEQAQGADLLDARTDVYSLGVTLYEALTGEVPFRGAPHMVLQQVIGDDPRPLRRLNDAVPRDLEVICLKAMAKEPERRYPTAAALRDDLRRWLNGEPIRARPVRAPERLWRWCLRRSWWRACWPSCSWPSSPARRASAGRRTEPALEALERLAKKHKLHRNGK